MIRMCLVAAVCLAAFSGCATTEKLASKVSLGGSNTPMQLMLKAQPDLVKNQNSLSIRQVFNRVEAPTVAQITVLQTGLMDDSVAAIRNEYVFKREDAGKWQLQSREQSYKCMRGKNIINFQIESCS